MGIAIEVHPDLALRAPGTPGRRLGEMYPASPVVGETYPFRKSGQRVYWFGGAVPLVHTDGNQQLGHVVAWVRILYAKHTLQPDGSVETFGEYRVERLGKPGEHSPW